MASAIIFGCSSLSLTEEEKEFFTETQPLGIILFTRNCKSPTQIRFLVEEIKACLYHPPCILIDQEGGRVARLIPPTWPALAPAHSFTDAEEVFFHARDIGKTLKSLGITVNLAPCSDLLLEGADPIIGDRAFSDDPTCVENLAFQMMKGLMDVGIMPTLKHMPGHGRAPTDSHKTLPVVKTQRSVLEATDFAPFRGICKRIKEENLPWPWAMTAHVLYEDLDPHHPATHSSLVIKDIIRDHIGFEGVLISDCLTMKALSGSFSDRAFKAFDAGCDIVLHCSAHMDEMEDVFSGLTQFQNTRLQTTK